MSHIRSDSREDAGERGSLGAVDLSLAALVFLSFSLLYCMLATFVSGEGQWWLLDHIAGFNVFYGDDAYRFFIYRSAWINSDLYAYNFVLPVALLIDGSIVSLAGGDLLSARMMHAMASAFALSCVFVIGIKLGFGRTLSVAQVLLLGLMPHFAMVSLSFYGEVWLGFFIVLISLFVLGERFYLASFLSGLLPLIRPEGIFFLLPMALYLIKGGRWKCLTIMLFPGMAYACFLLLSMDDISRFGAWRFELRAILEKVPIADRPLSSMAQTYTLFLVLPALFGWLYSPLCRLWPVLVGVALWLAYLSCLTLLGLSDYEMRYTFSILPVLIILFSGFMAFLLGALKKHDIPVRYYGFGAFFIFPLVILLNAIKIDMIGDVIERKGYAGLVREFFDGGLFPKYSQNEISAWKEMSGHIHALISQDDGIERLIIFKPQIYYFIDPASLPAHVQVGYPAMGYLVFRVLLDGEVFIQKPYDRQYSYVEFGAARFTERERRALYVDMMPMPDYPYRWEIGDTQLYLLSYRESDVPRVDLSSRPAVMKSDLLEELSRWTL